MIFRELQGRPPLLPPSPARTAAGPLLGMLGARGGAGGGGTFTHPHLESKIQGKTACFKS